LGRLKGISAKLGHVINDAEQAIDSLTLHISVLLASNLNAPFNQDLSCAVVEAEITRSVAGRQIPR
jgi:hypothetical protein